MPDKVSVRDLKKSYGPVQAVRGVRFEVSEGEIFGLLGPNGAGKTTTLECIIGLRDSDAGQIEVCGLDTRRYPREVKQRIGVQLQSTALQDRIKLSEALHLFGSFYRRQADPIALLERFSLAEKANARFENLSGGQKQRLAIALALVNEPEVLFLDEPTAGLDPQSRRELHALVRQMRQEGRTVVLTTHYIEEAEQLCDRIAIIDHGQIIATGTPRQLVNGSRASPRISFTSARPPESARLGALGGVQSVELHQSGAMLSSTDVGRTMVDLVMLLQSESNDLTDVHVHKPSLEDVFIELTGHSIRD